MAAEGSKGIEGTGTRGTVAVVGGAGATDVETNVETEGAEAGGSSVCSAD